MAANKRKTSIDKKPKVGKGLCVPEVGQALRDFCGLSGEEITDDMLRSLTGIASSPISILVSEKSGSGIVAPHPFKWIPGHHGDEYGPERAKVDTVIVCGYPSEEDSNAGKYLSDATGALFREALQVSGCANLLDNSYVTGLCKFFPPNKKLEANHISECAWLLWYELSVIRPKYILLLGSEAIKHFHGSQATVGDNRGAHSDIAIESYDNKKLNVITFCTFSPNALSLDPSAMDNTVADLKVFADLIGYESKATTVRNYRPDHKNNVLSTVEAVEAYVSNAIDKKINKFAIDCEWSGRNPYSDGALMTIQLSSGVGDAVLVPIRKHPRRGITQIDAGKPDSVVELEADDPLTKAGQIRAILTNGDKSGLLAYVHADCYEGLGQLVDNFTTDEFNTVVELLKKLLCRPEVSVGGHNFAADYAWLKAIGIVLDDQFVNGFDTMLKHHLLHESSKQDLMTLSLKYTDLARYDKAVFGWIKDYADDFSIIPEHILYDYALCDADATFEINEKLDKEFPEWLSDLAKTERDAALSICEMYATGLCLDKDRLLELALMYDVKRNEILTKIRTDIHWPEFNPRSVQEMRELLFGEEYNGAKRGSDGAPKRLRPEGAHCCRLNPIKTTGKGATNWDDEEDLDKNSPSTDRETLGILAAESDDPIVVALRQYRFIDQACKQFAALPEDGKYHAGLAKYIDTDGRLRTTLLQLTETGRWSSSRPNLQNIPKRREKELSDMFNSDSVKPYRLRSVFTAPPDSVLIEADYAQAELMTLAVLSGDMFFYNVLTEVLKVPVVEFPNGTNFWLHPAHVININCKVGDVIPAGARICDYNDSFLNAVSVGKVVEKKWTRDLHAERAISGFQLPYSPVLHGPPKAFVESTAKDKRVAAKTVNFGIPYGRSANAISRELKQEGVDVTADDCQKMIDGYHSEFGLVSEFLDKCAKAVVDCGYLITPFNRCRRFMSSSDQAVVAKQQREASNFPIQSVVADCLNKAVVNFRRIRSSLPADIASGYAMALAIHDAALLIAKYNAVRALITAGGVIDYCMTTAAKIPCPNKTVCGGLYSNAIMDMFPYGIVVDKSIYFRWDEKPTKEELEAIKLDGIVK